MSAARVYGDRNLLERTPRMMGHHMGNLRKSIASITATAALTGGLVVLNAAPAAAAVCPASMSPIINGARAHWKLACKGRDVSVSGWLEDTRLDGKCAQIAFDPGAEKGGIWFANACGSGTRENYNFLFRGTHIVRGYLQLDLDS
jgi:hypothetical protein